MSELDGTRRERLTQLLRRDGQAVITTTELAHVPGAEDADVTRIAVDGRRGRRRSRDVAQGAPAPPRWRTRREAA